MTGNPALDAIVLSLFISLAAVVGSLPLGIAVGWSLARHRFPGKSLLETIVNLPLVLPPVVTGYGLLVLFGQNGPLGALLEDWFGIRVVFDWKGAALAAAVVSFPLMVRSIRVAFASVDGGLIAAARSLGAGPVDRFLTVALPLARSGVIAGIVLAFARSLGEFGATIMIAGNIPGQTRTIPLYLYTHLETPGGLGQAWPVITASVALSAVALLLANRLEVPQTTAMGQRNGRPRRSA